jgi:hypothetical protein
VATNVSCTLDDDVVERADTTSARAVVLTGPNSDLNAAIDVVYELDGAGSQQRLTLAGTFPVVGTRSDPALFNTTDLTISADVIDGNTATGSVTGTFTTTAGNVCVINSGTISLSR